MTGQQGAEIVATVHVNLLDYLSLRIWNRWVYLPRIVPIFFGAVLVGLCAGMAIGGVPFQGLGRNFVAHWPTYALMVFVSLLIVIALPLVFAPVRWMLPSTPREIRFVFDDAGIGYATAEMNVKLAWATMLGYSETGSAIFIRGKRISMRLPKRSLPHEMLAPLRTLFESKGLLRVSIWRFR
jgi:hypothetical protein